MGTHAQQKLEALTFRNKHGLNAAHDVFKVSRTALYRWRKAHREGRASALHDRIRALVPTAVGR